MNLIITKLVHIAHFTLNLPTVPPPPFPSVLLKCPFYLHFSSCSNSMANPLPSLAGLDNLWTRKPQLTCNHCSKWQSKAHVVYLQSLLQVAKQSTVVYLQSLLQVAKQSTGGLPAIIVTSETVIRIISSPICSSIKFRSFRHSIRTIQMQLRDHSWMTSHKYGFFWQTLSYSYALMHYALCACITKSPTPPLPTCVMNHN